MSRLAFLFVGVASIATTSCTTASMPKGNTGQVTSTAVAAFAPEVAAVVDAAASVGTVLPITGIYQTSGQVVKADMIVFQGDSTLEFTNLNYPFVVIETDRLRFQAPYDVATITRLRNVPAAGPGQTITMPKLIIRAKKVEAVGYTQDYQNFKVVIDMSGVKGSDGHQGAQGPQGPAGADGRNGSDGPAYCKSGAGDGKDGGQGGPGYPGQNGGNGSNGGDVELISDSAGISLLTLADIRNRGGEGGKGGPGGPGGAGGPGGSGGKKSHFCGRGEKGRQGPTGPTGPRGKDGQRGTAGTITFSP